MPSESTPNRLDVGQAVTRRVSPRERHVPSGVLVSPNETYRFHASGIWRDLHKKVDHAGWNSPLFNRWARVPSAWIFRLCASIGKDDRTAFAIDLAAPWSVPAAAAAFGDRQLYLFANDLWHMYWNNSEVSEAQGGPMHVTITRIA